MQSFHFNEILKTFNKSNSKYYKKILSIIITALKREESILITYDPQKSVTPQSISSFLEFITTSILPLSISITNVHSKTKIPINRRNKIVSRNNSKVKNSPGIQNLDLKRSSLQNLDDPSPFVTNISIFESLHTFNDIPLIIKTQKEMALEFEGEYIPLAVPFLIFGIIPDSIYLSRDILSIFSFNLHIKKLPEKIPNINNSIFQVHSTFLPEKPLSLYIHRDILSYIAKLILKLDCLPLVTSFIDPETKLLIPKVAEDFAFFNGRDFLIPEDIKTIFPSLISHKFLLPTSTNMENSLKTINEILNSIPIPV